MLANNVMTNSATIPIILFIFFILSGGYDVTYSLELISMKLEGEFHFGMPSFRFIELIGMVILLSGIRCS